MDLQVIGRRVRDARRAKGLSQKELADAVGIAPNTIGAIERGAEGQPRKLELVTSYLGVAPIAEDPLPPDVELVTKAIGIWLLKLPEEDRPEAVYRVLRAIAT